ncbi:MAG: hypothetical protein H7Y20_12960, partial [Bryobacteraceae bacterium]|nr:hypothetical protein [Bryobacteraceae bacterium]
ENPVPDIRYELVSRNSSISFLWAPSAGKRIIVQGSYTRSAIRSDISYIAPQFFERERSLYRDNAHTADARVDLVLPKYAGLVPRMSFGGTFFLSSGSRPTQHYQPTGRLNLPLTKSVSWVSDWRYHGFGETFYSFESFRTHLITTGLQISR